MTDFISVGKRAVWKYQFEKLGETTFEMPGGAEIVRVGAQNFRYTDRAPESKVSIWALVNPEVEKVKRKFSIVSTGEEFDMRREPHRMYFETVYKGTAIFSNNTVWHVFEIIDRYP